MFSYDRFLRPITTSDNNIQVLDNAGSVVYTINPFSVGSTRVSNNVLKISFKSGKIIPITFSSINESKIALSLFQSQIDTLLEKTPTLMDIKIKNYINYVIDLNSSSGTSGSSGSAGTSGIDGTFYGSSGTSGVNGTSGTSGIDGSPGTSGADGSPGTSGADGSSGTSGADGLSGTSGADGSSGTSGVSNSYSATSSTTIIVPDVGYVVNFGTQDSLAYTSGQTVLMYSELPNLYVDDDYTEEYGTIIGEVDSYDKITGSMSIVVDYSQSIGNTYSYWYINLTGTLFDTPAGATGPNGSSGTSGTSGSSGTSGTSGSSGTSGTSGSSGTSGTSPSTNLTLSGDLLVNGTATFSGLTVLQEVSEVINSTPAATASTVVYDFLTGSNWYHSSVTTNYTANFINIPTDNNRAITTTIILNQGPTPYIPHALQIGGTASTIKWSGGTASGTANQVDIVGFTFIRSGNSWAQVLGQINTFD